VTIYGGSGLFIPESGTIILDISGMRNSENIDATTVRKFEFDLMYGGQGGGEIELGPIIYT